MDELLKRIETTPGCTLYPAKGEGPQLMEGCVLPEDLAAFYRRCGGASLYTDYAVELVSPERFIPANPVLVGELCPEDISAQWYIVGDLGDGNYITIDLSPERNGRCYDSAWDCHGIVGSCAVIALSFTDLLQRFLDAQGNYWYWLEEDFTPLGDAYDDCD